MTLETNIIRRMATVNRRYHPTISLEYLGDSSSGGVHFLAQITTKRKCFVEQFYIPKIMRPDLERGNQNKSLNDKLKFTI